jgi:crossover junction endodeoxyribonuclease RuvC
MPKVETTKVQTTIVGVDPGQSGGICVLRVTSYRNLTSKVSLEPTPMPETELDLDNLVQSITDGANVFIENVHSMPKQGVASSFKFGMNFGMVKQAFVRHRRIFITPQRWQKALGVVPRKKTENKDQFKKRLNRLAQELYPDLNVFNENQTSQLKVSDSILIAEYGLRFITGQLRQLK